MIPLTIIDWAFIIGFLVFSLIVGVLVSKRAGSSSAEFFLSGRSMPWWLLGISMVATTFSTDTPNLVTDIVRQKGVYGNWVWWSFLLTGMLTVFVYSHLWRRSGILTDIEFYELRYSGKTAAFLRGFRAIYLGVFFNVFILATVTLAAIKIGRVVFSLSPFQTIMISIVVTVTYTMLGGLRGVLITDLFQFCLAMTGSVLAAKYALNMPDVGGLNGLITHVDVVKRLDFLPNFSTIDPNTLVAVFIIPLAVQWWSVWYPGAEPGGGGYLVQRMLSAKNEKHAVAATLLFNIAHYALRPWPWIIVALCSLIIFPDLTALKSAFPAIEPSILAHDLAYPAMLITCLPAGILGLVLASLIAAYMSTVSTHLNWGASYIVNDFYLRFVKPGASEKRLVLVGRIATLLLMILSCTLAPFLESAKTAFDLILQIGAGTGLIFIVRWFWWRVNALSELTAMTVSFVVALIFFLQDRFCILSADLQFETWHKLLIGVGITTISWVAVAFISPPTDLKVLLKFYKLIRPSVAGWKKVIVYAQSTGETVDYSQKNRPLAYGILAMAIGVFATYFILFATGYWIYGQKILSAVMGIMSFVLFGVLLKIRNNMIKV